MRYRKPLGTQSANALPNVMPPWSNPLCKLPMPQTLVLVGYKSIVKLNIVWWHLTQSGDVCFNDDDSDLEYHSAGPQLLHFRNSNLEDVSERAGDTY